MSTVTAPTTVSQASAASLLNAPAWLEKTYTAPNGVQHAFVFRRDGYFNMTKAAKAFGKRIDNFMVNEETRCYLEALTDLVPGKPLISVQRGNGSLPSVGTWAHPKLAVFFARWLDIRFAVWCDSVIDDIRRGKAELVVTKPEESAVVALPQDYSKALRALADAVDKQQEAERVAQQAIAKAAQTEAV